MKHFGTDGRHLVRPADVGECVIAANEDGAMDDDGVSGEGEEDEECEFGSKSAKKMQDPLKPSSAEVDDHMEIHLPYRSWCRHCVRGRGRQSAHMAGTQEPTISEVHFDYGFLGNEKEPGKTVPAMVAKERKSRLLMAAVTPTKTTGTYIAKRVMGFLKEIGC